MPTEEELRQQADDAAKAAEEAKAKEEADAKAKADEEEVKAGAAQAEEDEAFIKSLLHGEDGHEETEEEKLRKNKDAEEARKRREAESKARKDAADAEAKKKAGEEEAKKKAEEASNEAKKKADEEAKKKSEEEASRTNKLGAQLIEFKKAHPDVSLEELDKDPAFKRFINGKLLGKQDFSSLYDDFVETKAEILKTDKDTVDKNYRKANSSSGSGVRGGEGQGDIYSEDEMKKLASKIPFMSSQEYAKIESKLEKSIKYHDNKK